MQTNSVVRNLALDSGKHSTSTPALVPRGGKLPNWYRVPSSRSSGATVRFTAKDGFERPQAAVLELLPYAGAPVVK
jgi:hypothetical protein